MQLHVPVNHPEAIGYTHAVETPGPLLFISGQTPKRPDGGPVATSPEDQLRQTYTNLRNVLETAGLGFEHLVHVRVFLASRRYAPALTKVRREMLGEHEPGITVVICGIYNEDWVAEIEAVAEFPQA
jgi:2-iminobutanoate/2-iminopropanoate deaminase